MQTDGRQAISASPVAADTLPEEPRERALAKPRPPGPVIDPRRRIVDQNSRSRLMPGCGIGVLAVGVGLQRGGAVHGQLVDVGGELVRRS